MNDLFLILLYLIILLLILGLAYTGYNLLAHRLKDIKGKVSIDSDDLLLIVKKAEKNE